MQHWITHNEPWVAAFLGHYFGLHAPGWRDLHATLQVVHHMLLSHGLAVPVIKEAGGQASIAPNIVPGHAAGEHPADIAAARRHDGYVNRWFLDPLSGRGYPQDMWDYYNRHSLATPATPAVQDGDMETIAVPIDFLGVNYYNRRLAADNPDGKPPQVRTVEDAERPRTLDREIYPRGLYETLIRLHRDYDFPALYVTENGAAVSETVEDDRVLDPQRRQFLQDHFAQAAHAIDEGAPLRGYFVWSLLDIAEVPRQDRLPVDGASLLPLLPDLTGFQNLSGLDDAARPIFSEYHLEKVKAPSFMVRHGRLKYIYIHEHGSQLFDLHEDPDEWHNLVGEDIRFLQEIGCLDESELRDLILSHFDPDQLAAQAAESVHRRLIIKEALARNGARWDFTPHFDGATQYVR